MRGEKEFVPSPGIKGNIMGSSGWRWGWLALWRSCERWDILEQKGVEDPESLPSEHCRQMQPRDSTLLSSLQGRTPGTSSGLGLSPPIHTHQPHRTVWEAERHSGDGDGPLLPLWASSL